MFSHNIGRVVNKKGDGKVCIYDFGSPRLDILPIESRQRLRKLINQKKRAEKPELPILIIKETHRYNDNYIGYITKQVIAPGTKMALGKELGYKYYR